jgi:hypothetical protein
MSSFVSVPIFYASKTLDFQSENFNKFKLFLTLDPAIQCQLDGPTFFGLPSGSGVSGSHTQPSSSSQTANNGSTSVTQPSILNTTATSSAHWQQPLLGESNRKDYEAVQGRDKEVDLADVQGRVLPTKGKTVEADPDPVRDREPPRVRFVPEPEEEEDEEEETSLSAAGASVVVVAIALVGSTLLAVSVLLIHVSSTLLPLAAGLGSLSLLFLFGGARLLSRLVGRIRLL